MWHTHINTGMPDTHSHSARPASGHLTFQTLSLGEPTLPVQINKLDLHHPPSISWGHEDLFYVVIEVDARQVRQTPVVGKSELPWKETFDFDASLSSVITLRVFARRKLHEDKYVGSVQSKLDTFLGSSGKAVLYDVSPPRSHDDHHAAWKTEISFSIEVAEPSFPDGDEALQAKPSAQGLATSFDAIAALFPNDNKIQQTLNSANSFIPLLEKINLFLTVTAAIGNVHPYVQVAAVVIVGVVKVCTAHIRFKNNIICALSAQTVECLYFLRDVVKSSAGCTVRRLIWMINTERKFHEYTRKFQELRAALQELATISTAVKVLRIYDEVHGISTQISLDSIHYAEDVHYTNVDECRSLEPVHRQLRDEISHWINGDSAERIFYLCGPAQCGKTAIAREVAHLFDGLQRLGSSYFVRKSHELPHDPSCIFRNISCDIADHNPHFKQAVGERVKRRAIRSCNHIRTQFQELILEPAKQVNWCGPLVIVIDALDVCAEHQKGKDLLNILANEAAELPFNFRILVTSCPRTDIVHALKDKPHVAMKILKDATLPDNDSGISFSPVSPCGRRSPSPTGDSVSGSDPEERGDLTEHVKVYRSYEFSHEQDIYPCDFTSPPPPYVHEMQLPGDRSRTPGLRTTHNISPSCKSR
ncbi:hypothetical protein EDD17DRAFT_745147 [Pisolithus thermaeus]|nr:hypothetical protein EDD17DRAFT_745147 [Pisolithus thermaeus]